MNDYLEFEKQLELAWAAGFFDGEGCTMSHRSGKYEYLKIVIGQSSNDGTPELLLKFKRIVNSIGNIGGPYKTSKNNKNHKLLYRWDASSEKAEQVLTLLWPYLGEVKREQATKAGFLYWGDALTNSSDASQCTLL